MAERSNGQNRLANETSPYLLQHAGNPVDWFPWGEEAMAKARAEDKPILLSVGYSTCHWCHVMAHESFEDPAIAEVMNRNFVNIKVDREERPDVDSVYMTAVQAMTGQGGWPMTVFMTPEGKPFYAGTYFPPADSHGRPGFPRVLDALHRAWTDERDQVLASADDVVNHLRVATGRVSDGENTLSPDVTVQAARHFAHSVDAVWGGFGSAPKFPSPGNLEFLLAHHASGASPNVLPMVDTTLRQMALGGIYDQLGGGFARYSVDVAWVVPHFEKMLYDNAQLITVYLHAFQLTRDPLYERVVRETLAYLEREMLGPEGGFFSAQDADSEGIEGKFFLWTVEQVAQVLGDDAAAFNDVFGVTPEGNFRDPHHPELIGRNVLTFRYDHGDVAARHGIPEDELDKHIAGWRQRMFDARDRRVYPGLDDKVLTSWNGLMLGALAEAARILDHPHYHDLAERNAAFLRERMWHDGRLLHTYKAGQARIDGMLEDYAYVGLGLVSLYRLTGDLAHLEWAAELLQVILERFRDDERPGFYDTPHDGEQLILRQHPLFDAATPSGNGATALLALWLGRYYARDEWLSVAEDVVGLVADHILNAPNGFGSILQAIEFSVAPERELAIVGEPSARAPFERVAAGRYDPWLMLAPSSGGEGLPVLQGRGDATRPVAYLCEDLVCGLPATDPEKLREQLGA